MIVFTFLFKCYFMHFIKSLYHLSSQLKHYCSSAWIDTQAEQRLEPKIEKAVILCSCCNQAEDSYLLSK